MIQIHFNLIWQLTSIGTFFMFLCYYFQFYIHGFKCIKTGYITVTLIYQYHISVPLLQFCSSYDEICWHWDVLSHVACGVLSQSWANCHVRWVANQIMLPGTLLCMFAWECHLVPKSHYLANTILWRGYFHTHITMLGNLWLTIQQKCLSH